MIYFHKSNLCFDKNKIVLSRCFSSKRKAASVPEECSGAFKCLNTKWKYDVMSKNLGEISDL